MLPLAKRLKKTDKSVHPMPGPSGKNILETIKILLRGERVRLRVEAQKQRRRLNGNRNDLTGVVMLACQPVRLSACERVSSEV